MLTIQIPDNNGLIADTYGYGVIYHSHQVYVLIDSEFDKITLTTWFCVAFTKIMATRHNSANLTVNSNIH